MPQNAPVTLIPGSLPEWYCFQNWQQVNNDFFSGATAFLPGAYNTFNYGNTEPVANDRGKPWFRLNSDGTPDRWYVYYSGSWISRHLLLPGFTIIAPSTLTSASAVWSWDGGDGSNPATTTPSGNVGAMWEVDTFFEARSPIGAGTLTSGTVLSVGDTGGEENHLLTIPEIPSHDHAMSSTLYPALGSGTVDEKPQTGGTARTGATGGGLAHNNMHPYAVRFFIRRTNRLYYSP